MPVRLPIAVTLALIAGSAAWPAAAPDTPTLLIRGARVIDGEGPARVRDVLIRAGRIDRVAPAIAARGVPVVEGAGLTLVPGLTDLHIHSRADIFAEGRLAAGYAPYLDRGVLSVNELSAPREWSGAIRDGVASGALPRVRVAVRLGVPGGHGTESEWTESLTATVSTPAEAHAAMAEALATRPDLVKVFADGWRYGRAPDRPDMDAATLRAIVADAHRAHLPVLTHTVTLAGLKRAARAGVDAVAHGVGDAALDAEALRLLRRHRVGYIPTLSAYEPLAERRLTPEERDDLSPAARAAEDRRVAAPVPEYESRRWAIMRANLAAVARAGVRIGVGTDSGVTGVYAGWATRHEMRLLVEAGLTPRQALDAATLRAARILGDRRAGRVRRGAPADLILTAGRPDERLADLYDLRVVIRAGRIVQRSAEPR